MECSHSRQLNSRLNSCEYDSTAEVMRSLPRAVFVELTQGCNLKCSMCRNTRISTHSRLMSDELFAQIAETLFPVAELVDIRGWGESLILRDIENKLRHIAKYGPKVRVVSNLSFYREAILLYLLSINAEIAVSLDTVDPSLLKLLRTGTNLELVKKNLMLLSDNRRYDQQVYLLVTVQRPALTDLSNIINFAYDCGVKEIRLFSVTATAESPLSLFNCCTDIDFNLSKAAAVAKKLGIKIVLATKLGCRIYKSNDSVPCIHPWSYCYISYNGDVTCCDHLIGPGNAEYVIGNLTVSTFDNVWNGPKAQTFRHMHASSGRSQIPLAHCRWCYSEKYVDFEHYFDCKFTQTVVSI